MSAAGRSASAVDRPGPGRSTAMRRLGTTVLAALAILAPSARADDPVPLPAAAPPVTSAQNLSITIQVLWQVQQGCIRHCDGSLQIQDATQASTTVQVAAVEAAASGGATTAANASFVVQVIVQTQLGCIAFCSGTTRLQSAAQQADVSQLASSISAAVAGAQNSSAVTQLVWQYQDACETECHDVSVAQITVQGQTTAQGATAGAKAAPDLEAFKRWLATVAATATVDVVMQIDEAACLEHCAGDVQVQVSVQTQSTTQDAAGEDPTPPTIADASPPVVLAVPVDAAPAHAAATLVRAAKPRTGHAPAARRHRKGAVRIVPARCRRLGRNVTRTRRRAGRTIRFGSETSRTTIEGSRCGS